MHHTLQTFSFQYLFFKSPFGFFCPDPQNISPIRAYKTTVIGFERPFKNHISRSDAHEFFMSVKFVSLADLEYIECIFAVTNILNFRKTEITQHLRPKMSDPCECVFNHEAIMRRILSILQGIQTDCTDTECSTSAGGDPNAAAGSNILLIAMAWGVFAMLMFFMRPASMRSGGSERENGQLTEKPSSAAGANNNNNNNDNNGNGPPPGDVF